MKGKLIFWIALLSMVATPAAFAANPEPFDVTIKIREPITITENAFLDFGVIDVPAALTTYTVAAAATGHSAGTGANAADFTVTGESGYAADVSVTSPVSATVGATTLNFNLQLASGTATDVINFAGSPITVYVGGAVDVPAGADAGTYTTTSQISVVYQ